MIKLEYYRIKQGFTVYRLSELTGISRKHITKCERGISSPTADKIIDICLALSITPNELLGWEEIRNDKRKIARGNDS